MKEQKEDLSFGDLLILLEQSENMSDENKRYTIDRYRKHDVENLTGNKHRMIVGHAANLTMMVIKRGGTEDECKKMLEYLSVCIDAKKYHLDYKECYEDLEIEQIMQKYNDKNIAE